MEQGWGDREEEGWGVEVVGEVADEGGGGEVFAVTEEEGLLVGVGVVEAGNDRIDKVGDIDEAAVVIDRAEGEGKARLDEFNQAFHVTRITGTVNEGGTDYRPGHGGVLAKFDQGGFGGEFAFAVGGVGITGGGFGEGVGAEGGHCADGANEDEVFDSSLNCSLGEIDGYLGIDFEEFGGGVGSSVLEDVRSGSEVDDGVDTGESLVPVGVSVEGGGLDLVELGGGEGGISMAADADEGVVLDDEGWGEVATDEACVSGDEYIHAIDKSI